MKGAAAGLLAGGALLVLLLSIAFVAGCLTAGDYSATEIHDMCMSTNSAGAVSR